MPFLIISIVIFISAIVIFLILLGLWTYHDAKEKTDKPSIWTAIVVLTPNLFGLIIYFLIGRKQNKMINETKQINRYKKPVIISAVCLFLTAGILVGSFIHLLVSDKVELPNTFLGMRISIGKTESYWNQRWKISFRSSDEEFIKTVKMNGEDLDNFHVTGNCEQGKIFLRISQEEDSVLIDISDSFDEIVDMSRFESGKVKIMVICDAAKGAEILIDWR